MSTTVSYKGQTLATVSNQTKTLLTEGKYLEDDLTLTDVSGGGSTLITKNISENGTYNASSDSADGYSQVTVTVPASAVDSGTKSITANGNNQDVVGYAAVDVAVPNSYSASDEGKVVDSGALVAQTAHADVTPTTSDQTIDTTTNNSIKVKGDANLVAGNIKKDVTIFNTTGTYEGGGGGISVDDIATNSAPSGAITLSSSVTSIGIQAFTRKPITSISGSGVTSVGDSAFENCSSLTSASFPALVTVGTSSFRSGKYASISLPSVTTVGASAFQANTNTLTSISLPEATTIGNNFVYDCQKLTSVDIPKCTKINGNSFQQCYALEFLDLPKVTQIDGNAFYNARKLATLVLRHTSVVTLSNVSAFVNTPIRGYNSGSGVIYVPNSLINSYKTASNWVNIFNEGHVTFSAIEGSQYE